MLAFVVKHFDLWPKTILKLKSKIPKICWLIIRWYVKWSCTNHFVTNRSQLHPCCRCPARCLLPHNPEYSWFLPPRVIAEDKQWVWLWFRQWYNNLSHWLQKELQWVWNLDGCHSVTRTAGSVYCSSNAWLWSSWENQCLPCCYSLRAGWFNKSVFYKPMDIFAS